MARAPGMVGRMRCSALLWFPVVLGVACSESGVGAARLPEAVQRAIPVPPGAVAFDPVAGRGPGVLFGYEAPMAPEDVLAFYQAELPARGWELDPPKRLPHRVRLGARRSHDRLELDLVEAHDPGEPTRILGAWRSDAGPATR